MSSDSHCIFCQIIAGTAPATRLYEDAQAIVILDLFPVHPGHTLIIPRHHGALLEHQLMDTNAHLMLLAQRVIQAHKLAGLADAHNLLVNDGKVANQHVPHVHLHVVPRQRGDTLRTVMRWWTRMLPLTGARKRREALEQIAARLRPHFSESE